MRTTQSATQKKQHQFRLQIRRRQIQKLLSVHRHQLGTLTPPAAINLCRNNLRQLYQIIRQQPNTVLYGHHRLHILLKQLRDISFNSLAQQIFALRDNINTVLQLQNRNKWLDNSSTVFLHQIILNISADPTSDSQGMKISPISIQQLNIKQNLQSNNPQLLKLTIKILKNILQLDPTSKTIYYLITKVQIYKLLLILFIDRQQIYHIHKLQNIVIWFCNTIINKVIRYKFQYVDKDWGNFINFLFSQLQDILQSKYRHNQQQNITENHQMQVQQNVITIDDMLIYFKTLIKTTVIQLNDQLIQKLQHYFCPSNIHYIDYLNTLTYTTMYSLPLSHLQSLLTYLLSHPTFKHSSKIMRCIANSLINNGQHYKTILNIFIQYSQQKPLNQILNIQDDNKNYSQYSLLMYFMYYLNNIECQYDMVEIIGVIIIAQGGLGIFQEGLQYLMESNLFKKKICSYGFQIQEQM